MITSFPFTRRSHVFHYEDWALLCINLILGFSFCFILAPKIFGSGISILDPDGFGVLGRSWYETGRFESIQRGPLYPGLIAVVSRLVGAYSVASIQVVQCLLSGLSIVIARRIYMKTIGQGSRWAAWITAVFPILIWYTARLWVETLLIFLLACQTLLCISWAEKPSLKFALACGAVTGLAALCKGIMLSFVVWIPVAMMVSALTSKPHHIRRYKVKRILHQCTFFVAAALMIIFPWSLRNWRLTGELIPIHTGFGFNFFIGNSFARNFTESPLSYSQLWDAALLDTERIYTKEAINSQDPILQDQALLITAMKEFLADPWFLAQKMVINFLLLSYLAADGVKSAITGLVQLPFFILALSGTWRAVKHRSAALWLLVPAGGLLLPTIFISAFARLAAPALPYIIGLAVYGLAVRRWRNNE